MAFFTLLVAMCSLALGFGIRELLIELEKRSDRVNRLIRHVKARYLPKPKPKRLSLLGLPGELRNAIYREALVSPARIAVDKSKTHAQPALLQTCTQIRKEAADYYYYEGNSFYFDCTNLDFSPLIKFYQHLLGLGSDNQGRKIEAMIIVSGKKPSWSGLSKGLRAAHKNRAPIITYDADLDDGLAAVSGAFQIVKSTTGVPWEAVEKVLEVYKKAVVDSRSGTWQWH